VEQSLHDGVLGGVQVLRNWIKTLPLTLVRLENNHQYHISTSLVRYFVSRRLDNPQVEIDFGKIDIEWFPFATVLRFLRFLCLL
jgi:hypothetical protein